jgi:hypothetical protein
MIFFFSALDQVSFFELTMPYTTPNESALKYGPCRINTNVFGRWVCSPLRKGGVKNQQESVKTRWRSSRIILVVPFNNQALAAMARTTTIISGINCFL